MRPTDPDARVLARVADGDAAALTELYERYAGPLFTFLFRMAGDRGTAEEILQDTLLAVWRSAGTFQSRSRVSTWLFGVARRQAHNRLRGTPPPPAAEPYEQADRVPGPEELAVGGDWLQAALARLPRAQREVVVLSYLADLPHQDIAEVLGIPVGTVKSRLHLARTSLKEALHEQSV
ncbi:RNA polymerase sigma factor [Nonomuraea deserti]|uniref:RNA polymerase sigma factor n=1 Tax=Nonomuraea deserti TaxID=1848322 RepID=A0A4R4UXF3_9ACTN|nr:RNA polymerase sigma factor [Nonomuraea deserti]TDC97338.1 RNA polymerase sigma factor [Nonomuraea deserti]